MDANKSEFSVCDAVQTMTSHKKSNMQEEEEKIKWGEEINSNTFYLI